MRNVVVDSIPSNRTGSDVNDGYMLVLWSNVNRLTVVCSMYTLLSRSVSRYCLCIRHMCEMEIKHP